MPAVRIRVLMTQLWPQAGGRTRAVYLRNEKIRAAISSDVELVILDRSDDIQERIAAASKRFAAGFRVEGLFEKIRFQRSRGPAIESIQDIVFGYLSHFQSLSTSLSTDGRMATIMEGDEVVMTFWSRDGLSEYRHAGGFRAEIAYLTGAAKVIVGYSAGSRKFRIVLDSQGRLLSRGLYDSSGKQYEAEDYFNIFGETIFSSIGTPRRRSYRIYFADMPVFLGDDAYDDMVAYLFGAVFPMSAGDVLIADEPSLYSFALRTGGPDIRRILYFHWHNLGAQERRALEDSSVRKTAVFLTDWQRDDFLVRCGVRENEWLSTVVVDNILDAAGPVVQRSEGSRYNIVTVGRLAAEKDVERVLRVFSHFRKLEPDSYLSIVGDGPLRQKLERLTSKLGLADCVVFAGNLGRPYESKHFSKVDCALLTPRYESYGLVYPELISRGIPVVAVDAPYGPRRWIEDGSNGQLVEDEASDADVASCMQELVNSGLSPRSVSTTLDIDDINSKTELRLGDILIRDVNV